MLEAGTAEKQKKGKRRHIGLQERGKEFRGAIYIFSTLLFEPRHIRRKVPLLPVSDLYTNLM
jgi:hypothetical protein